METFPQIIVVDDQEKGLIVAKDLLYKKVNDQTLLLLSGGSTPKDLYVTIAKERKLKAKAVGMVDERKNGSNYEMIKSTGLLDYLKNSKIKFYPIIQTLPYGKDIHKLIDSSKNRIAIMGVGEDGHTASIPARLAEASAKRAGNKKLKIKNQKYVEEINNFPIEPKNRITLTFSALAQMDLLLVLAFGESKKEALRRMFDPSAGSGQEAIEEIPARIYARPDIAPKTILITDQEI